MPRISFIVPAHNEEDHLPRTLDAVAAAAMALGLDHEVIVADDGSTDGTADLARARGAVVVSHARRQIAATRNLGARAAAGGLLFFVDADTVVSAEAVGEALAAIEGGAAGGGASVRFDGPVPVYARVMLPVLNALFRLCRITGGCFFFCTREALDRAGGWDETLYASEEIALAAAIKGLGPFVIVRMPVVTSGRKMRVFSGWAMLGLAWRAARSRGGFVRDREQLDMWYGPRIRERPPGG